MTTNEGQPTGRNPEWEINREQNAAIAKRIDLLLLEGPDEADELRISQQRFREEFREKVEKFPAEDPENRQEEIRFLEFLLSNSDITDQNVDNAVIRELTVEKISVLYHVENVGEHILVGVGYSKEALEEEGEAGKLYSKLIA